MDAIIEMADISELQKTASDSGADVSIKDMILDLASGNADESGTYLVNLLKQTLAKIKSRMNGIFLSLTLPMTASAVCCRISNSREMRFLASAICINAFLSIIASSLTEAHTLLGRISSVTSAAFPVVTGFLTMTGASSQALLTPMAGLVSTITANIMEKWGIYLCCAACACACASIFAGAVRLDGIFSILKTSVMWMCGSLMTVFVAILSINGLLGRSYDSAAMRTAQYAVDRILPVIGGGVSDSLGTVLASINIVKTASGVTGMLILLSICLEPVAGMWALSFAIKLSAAAVSPIDNTGITTAALRFSSVISMLMTVCLSSMTMSLVLLGAAVASGRSI